MPAPWTLAMELGNNSQLVGVFRTQVCNGFYFQSSVHSRFDGNLKQAANLITDCESACCAQIGARGAGICSAAAASMDYFMWIEQEALRGLQKRNELSAPYICLPLFSFLLLPLHPSLFWCFV